MSLADKKCVPCESKVPPYTRAEIDAHLPMLKLPWEVIEEKKLSHTFQFKDFQEAMAFINRIAEVAENEGHHPDMYIFYSRVRIELWTHFIGGLHENDFIMAAKIEKLV
jgi:4a-hydroxytetrahydrobiopterin dehydratase